jgi:hypothetical protein
MEKKGTAQMVYKIETPQGVLPYEFDSKDEAMDYVMGVLSWSGTKYRIYKAKKAGN